MIHIDGSIGEGGGQILRTSIALSAVTGRKIRIFNIRAKRQNPGLGYQHIAAIKAVSQLCKADTTGVEMGSKEITFSPMKIKGKRINIDVGTAGSLTLVLQALMIPAIYAPNEVIITLKGGTDVRYSPPIDYLRFVTLPILRRFNYNADIELIRRGYYPKGGGRILVRIKPSELDKIVLKNRGEIVSVRGISHAHKDLENAMVALRQIKGARSVIYNYLLKNENYKGKIEIKGEYVNTLSYGSGILLYARTENSVIGSSSLGERGKRAEIVGMEAGKKLVEELKTNMALDRYMADQIVPYLALAGGKIGVSDITEHCRTNIEVVRKFGFDVRVRDSSIISPE